MARLPYGKATKPIDEFDYEEAPIDADGKPRDMDHDSYCWLNAAYVMGARLTDAFASTGLCTAIRGAEGGGKVEGLPTHIFTSGRRRPRRSSARPRSASPIAASSSCPTCGFLPLLPLQEHRLRGVLRRPDRRRSPRSTTDPKATANAAISARLPYIMATSRVRPLPEGDGARQDRLVHGSERRRDLAEPLDPELRQSQRRRRPGDEGQLPAA